MDKTFDSGTAEPRIYAKWEEMGAFRAGSNARHGAESFCIMIPPPNVTGSLHMGHAFNNTIQDILIRWHRMRGFDVLWQPGQDHAGIATQMVVERQLAARGLPSRTELGREAFLGRIWKWKEQSGDIIINQLKRLGASCDWERNRFTMDDGFHHAVLKVFVELYNRGIIYRGKRLVNWDPHFQSAISDLEVEQVEVDGKLWHFRYPLEQGVHYRHPVAFDDDGTAIAWEDRNYLVVATTRPETMLGDTGVAVHPEDERYRPLVGKMVRLPLSGRLVPVVADSHADPTKGSGAVKITPAHDFNDWSVGERTGLKAINILNEQAALRLQGNAAFLESCSPSLETMELDGLDRHAARKRIVQLAARDGWLDRVEEERHVVPHGDRSKVAIEPFLTDQWFVDASRIVGPAIEAVRSGQTRILPEQFSDTYFRWLENIEPWCISRQLWWGHQIPVWYDEDGERYCAVTESEARRLAGGRKLRRDPDVLDTWFSSGLWPLGTLGWPEETEELSRYFPTDVLVTGFDIIFFWVARMMMMQLEIAGDIPFHTVYVHALVRDEHGKKMSKSLGNVIDPLDLINKYGADSVRFTLASMAAMGRDLRLSEKRVEGYRNFGTKLWNATRFAQLNDCVPDPEFDPATVQCVVNKWIVGETSRVRERVDEALVAYRFNEAAGSLYSFVWGQVCDWYVELAKSLLASESTAEETRRCMAWVIDQSLIMLHPLMPFITEELWAKICDRDGMLVHATWPEHLTAASLSDAKADRQMQWTIDVIEEIRSARSQMRIPPGKMLTIAEADIDAESREAYVDAGEFVRRLARVEPAGPDGCPARDSVIVSVRGAVFELDLTGVVDVGKEKSRLESALLRLAAEIKTLQKRLSNENFLARAPDHVIEKTRRDVAGKREEVEVISKAIARFGTD